MSDYLQKLFIDEAKAVLFKGSAVSGGGTDDPNGDVATDDEVGDIIDDIFNSGTTGGDTGDAGDDTGNTGDGDVATDDEVGDVIEDIFG